MYDLYVARGEEAPSSPVSEIQTSLPQHLTVAAENGSAVSGWPLWAAEMRRQAFVVLNQSCADAGLSSIDALASEQQTSKGGKAKSGTNAATCSTGQGGSPLQEGWAAVDPQPIKLVVPEGGPASSVADNPGDESAIRTSINAQRTHNSDFELWPMAAPFVEVHAGSGGSDAKMHALIKRAYRIIEQNSFLDWGLTSGRQHWPALRCAVGCLPHSPVF